MRCALAVVAALAALSARPDDLDVARQALRDGLWEIARAHAEKASGDEARLVVLESHAREGEWKKCLEKLGEWGDPPGDRFVCHRAAALFGVGNAKAAASLLDSAKISDPGCRAFAAILRARISLEGGDPAAALAALSSSGAGGPEARMVEASARERLGDRKAAEAIWRDVATSTNAPLPAAVAAAVKLGERAALEKVVSRDGPAAVKRAAALKLGVVKLKDAATFADGAKSIRSVVSDAPDAEGARDAFLALAEAHLDRGEFKDAAERYAEAVSIWPDAAKDATVQEGRGWAMSKLGRHEEALEAFSAAEEAATAADAKALAAVKAADCLAELGRGEEAMAKYREVREKYPKSAAAARISDLVRTRELEAKGRAEYAAYKFAEAQKTFAEVAERDPERRSRMEFFTVMCLFGQGRDAEAQALAERIAEKGDDPKLRAEASLWLGKFAYSRGKWREACDRFAAYADAAETPAAAAEAHVWSARAAFADNDFAHAIAIVSKAGARHPGSPASAAGMLVQGESLMELARFDEAALVLERASRANGVSEGDRLRALTLRADALFAMGADNAQRYREALDAYRELLLAEVLSPSARICLSFKVARTLEKLKRLEEAADEYYANVVVAYREGRARSLRYDDEARAAFARAAFRLAEEYESRGRAAQAASVLDLVSASDVPAAAEAARRADRIRRKGLFQ